MAGSVSFNLSPEVLEWARNSMGYTVDQAAQKAGVPTDRYIAWETGEKLPTYKQLEGLAEKVYKRSVAILLLTKPPAELSINKDFRNLTNSQIINYSPEIRLALRKAKRYQRILEEVSSNSSEPKFKKFQVDISDNPVNASLIFRDFLDLPLTEQKTWRHADAMRLFQFKVESLGIYIFKLKMPIAEARAFCLSGDFPIIVLNTEDSSNGQIFSLFHEVCHILFNINDVFKDSRNGELNQEYAKIESFCNQFAASFLVPENSFINDIISYRISKNNVSDSDIQRLARSYNVSNEVIARKFLQNDLITEDFFWGRKHLWDSAAKAAKKKENEKLKDNNSGINQGIKIIYEKGRAYVSNVVSAFNQGLISSSDLSNYLETKLSNLPKILERLNN